MAVNIDPTEHVARYFGFQKFDRSVDPPWVMPGAFELRQSASERYLSVNHCEHYQSARLQQLQSILGDLTAKAFNWKKSGGFAILNADRVVTCGRNGSRSLRVRRRQHLQDQSYASIDGLPLDNSDLQLLNMLAVEAVEVHLVSAIP
jgi:hypothetical protein